jgi:hypothetical protein
MTINLNKSDEWPEFVAHVQASALGEKRFLALQPMAGYRARYAKNTASFLAAVQIRCIASVGLLSCHDTI